MEGSGGSAYPKAFQHLYVTCFVCHLENPGGDGRIILKWIFERLDGGA